MGQIQTKGFRENSSATIKGKHDAKTSMAEAKRIQLPALGEYYEDLLTIDAWVNSRSKAMQGQSLLCAKLQERESRIKERVEYLAKKRGISADEMWLRILSGKAERMLSDEIEIEVEEE